MYNIDNIIKDVIHKCISTIPYYIDGDCNLEKYDNNLLYKLPRLLVELEDQFHIRVPDEDINIYNFNTVNKIINYVNKKVLVNKSEPH